MVIDSSLGILYFIQFSLQVCDLLCQFAVVFVDVIFNDQCSSFPSNMVLAGPPNATGLSLPLNALAEIPISQHYHFNSPPSPPPPKKNNNNNSHSIPSVPLLTYMYVIVVVIYIFISYSYTSSLTYSFYTCYILPLLCAYWCNGPTGSAFSTN